MSAPHSDVSVQDSKTLFCIADDLETYQQTLDLLDAQLAEPLPDDERASILSDRAEVQASIEQIGAALANKTDAVAAVLRRLGNEQELIAEERRRLKLREVATERADKWLRDYVISVMRKTGVKQLKTTNNTLFIRTSDAVEITDVEKLKDVYQNAEIKLPLGLWRSIVDVMLEAAPESRGVVEAIRVKAEPSLMTIKKAIKSGVTVAGADLQFRENLVVR